MDYNLAQFIFGGVYFLISSGWYFYEEQKEQGNFLVKIVSSALWLGPYFLGIYFGIETMGPIALLPPFAMWSFFATILGV